jgi:hypothetical protein
MGLSAAARSAAQSFDRTAADYDRLGDLSEQEHLLIRSTASAAYFQFIQQPTDATSGWGIGGAQRRGGRSIGHCR